MNNPYGVPLPAPVMPEPVAPVPVAPAMAAPAPIPTMQGNITGPEYLAGAYPGAPALPTPAKLEPFVPQAGNALDAMQRGAGGAGGANAVAGMDPFDTFNINQAVSEWEKAFGGRLDITKLEELGNVVRTGVIHPGLARKGIEAHQAEAFLAQFDMMYDRYKEDYLKANPEGITPTGNDSALKEGVAALGAGLVSIPGGIASLADYGVRYAGSMVDDLGDAISGEISWGDFFNSTAGEVMARQADGNQKTWLGAVGDGVADFAQGIREWGFTDETRAAQVELADKIANGTAGDVAKVLLNNPHMISTMALEMGGGLGWTGLATKLPKVASALQTMQKVSPTAARAVSATPTGLGYTGMQMQDFEESIMEGDFNALMTSPTNKAIYDSALEILRDPAAAEKYTRENIMARGLDDILAAGLVANIGLAAIPGLGGAEGAVTATARGVQRAPAPTFNRLRSAGRTAASEAPQEGIAGGLEQYAQNTASNAVDPWQGVVGSAMTEAYIGGGVGAGTGLVTAPTAPRRQPPAPTPGQAGTPGAPQPNAPQGAAGSAGQPTVFSDPTVPDLVDFAGKQQALNDRWDTLSATTTTKRLANNATTAQELINSVAAKPAEMWARQSQVPWNTLSLAQQQAVVRDFASRLNALRGDKAFPDFATELDAWGVSNTDTATPPVTPTPVPTPTQPVAGQTVAQPGATPPAFYDNLYSALSNPAVPNAVRSEPIYAEVQQAFDAGLITDRASLQAFVEAMDVPAPAPITAPTSQAVPAAAVTEYNEWLSSTTRELGRMPPQNEIEATLADIAEANGTTADALRTATQAAPEAAPQAAPQAAPPTEVIPSQTPAEAAARIAQARLEKLPISELNKRKLNTLKKDARQQVKQAKEFAATLVTQLTNRGMSKADAEALTIEQARAAVDQLQTQGVQNDTTPTRQKNRTNRLKAAEATAQRETREATPTVELPLKEEPQQEQRNVLKLRQKTPAEKAAETRAANTPPEDVKLPAELRKHKPEYKIGKIKYDPIFASPIDQAVYMATTGRKAISDQFRNWLKARGLTEAEINTRGQELKDRMGARAKTVKAVAGRTNTLRIPQVAQKVNKLKKATTPEGAPKPPKSEAPAQDDATGAEVDNTPTADELAQRYPETAFELREVRHRTGVEKAQMADIFSLGMGLSDAATALATKIQLRIHEDMRHETPWSRFTPESANLQTYYNEVHRRLANMLAGTADLTTKGRYAHLMRTVLLTEDNARLSKPQREKVELILDSLDSKIESFTKAELAALLPEFSKLTNKRIANSTLDALAETVRKKRARKPKNTLSKKAAQEQAAQLEAEEDAEVAAIIQEQNATPIESDVRDTTTDMDVLEGMVLEALADPPSNSFITEIASAIALAREGDTKPLYDLTKSLQNDEVITLAEAFNLRKMGQPVVDTTGRVSAEETIDITEDGDPDADLMADGWTLAETASPELSTTQQAHNNILASNSRTKVLDLFTAIAKDTQQSEFFRRMARKLGPILADYRTRLIAYPDSLSKTNAGVYMGKINAMAFNRAEPEVVLHEGLHAATSNFIRHHERIGNAQLTAAVKDLEALYAHVYNHMKRNPREAMAWGYDVTGDKMPPQMENVHELLAYGTTNPKFSAYLSTIAPPAGREEARSVWTAIRDAARKIGEHIWGRKFTPLERSTYDALFETTGDIIDAAYSDSNIIEQVRQVGLEGAVSIAQFHTDPDGFPVDDTEALFEQARQGTGIEMPEAPRSADQYRTPLTWLGDKARKYVNSTIDFETAMQNIVKITGRPIPVLANIMEAKIRSDGLRGEFHEYDKIEAGIPVVDWIRGNAARFGETAEQGLDNINKFFRNKNQLERNHVAWLLEGKLNPGFDLERDALMEEFAGATSAADASRIRGELEALMRNQAAETEVVFGQRNNEFYYRFQEGLTELESFGVNEESMAELNTLMDRVRERTKQRNLEAGKVSPRDFWIDLYAYKWYVNLSNDPETPTAFKVFEHPGAQDERALAILNKRVVAADGQTKGVSGVIEKTLAGLSSAGKSAAERPLMDALYEFVNEYADIIKPVMHVWEGTPKDGYNLVSGKAAKNGRGEEIKHVKKLPAVIGFTYHQGHRHITVQIDSARAVRSGEAENNPLLRGLAGIYTFKDVGTFTRIFGVGTNILARSFTTYNPMWTLSKSFLRDLSYLPGVLAMEHTNNALVAGSLVKDYYANLLSANFHPRNWGVTPAVLGTILTSKDSMRQLDALAAANPDSYVAWLRRLQKNGGGSNVRNEYNVDKLGKSLVSDFDNNRGIYVLKGPVETLGNYTSNWANFLEGMARTAMFKTLSEQYQKEGYSVEDADARAAAKTKDALNFDQQGTNSSIVNAYIPFFKVSVTGADKIRRLFIDDTGKFDSKKALIWGAYFSSVALAGMMLGAATAGDDEEQKDRDGNPMNRQDMMSLDVLTQNFIIWVDGKPQAIPIGLGLPQLMMAPGIIAHQLSRGAVTSEEALRAMYETVGRNAPVRPAPLAKDPDVSDVMWSVLGAPITASAVFAPIYGIAHNVDAFGNPIYTEFSQDDKFNSDQAKPGTLPMWTEHATKLREATGIDVHPEVLQYMLKSYTGSLSTFFLNITGVQDAREAIGLPAQSLPGVLGLQPKDMEHYLSRRVWDTKDTFLPSLRAYNAEVARFRRDEGVDTDKARSSAAPWLRQNPAIARDIGRYKALEKAQDEYYKGIAALRKDKLMSEERRKLERRKIDSRLRAALEKVDAQGERE